MHPEVKSAKPGKCPQCGMNLIEAGKSVEEKNSYTPLFIIIGLILTTTLALTFRDLTNGDLNFKKSAIYFMAGFFLIFSGFKLLDLKGFADGYSSYDLLAKKVPQYGYIYPFIELFFGLAMLISWRDILVLKAEVVLMTFSGIGVLIKILKKEKFQCACLGTFLKVPLTYVTLIEDFGMAFLALILLIF